MPFVPAQIEIKPASIGTGIKAGLRKSKKMAARLTLYVNMRIATDLGWQADDKIEVLLGEGTDHGVLRLRKNNSVGQAKAQRKDTGKAPFFAVALGHQAQFVDRAEAGQWVSVGKDRGRLA